MMYMKHEMRRLVAHDNMEKNKARKYYNGSIGSNTK